MRLSRQKMLDLISLVVFDGIFLYTIFLTFYSMARSSRLAVEKLHNMLNYSLSIALKPCFRSIGGISLTFFTTLAGLPIATLQGGILRLTILPAPMVHPSPMVTPGRMVTCPPIQQSSPIVTSRAYSMFSRRDWTSVSCVAAKMLTKGPNMHRSPMVTSEQSRMTRLMRPVSR